MVEVSGADAVPRPHTVRLADGRLLGWYEFGDLSGVPCVYLPGTPESGLAGGCYDAAARSAGVRWISLDKPGYGSSDPSPGRRLTDLPGDVVALADHLGIERFAVAGESGGGPQALAVARDLAERVVVVILLASAGTTSGRSVPPGMTALNTFLYRCLRVGTWCVRVAFAGMAFVIRHESRLPRLAALLGRGVPDADLRAMADPAYAPRLAAVADAFRHGSRPVADEFLMISSPWGFSPAEVGVPAQMWHGTADAHVPYPMAAALAGELPDVETHVDDECGHMVGFEHRDAVMAAVRAARWGRAREG